MSGNADNNVKQLIGAGLAIVGGVILYRWIKDGTSAEASAKGLGREAKGTGKDIKGSITGTAKDIKGSVKGALH
ncbi:hypothetical protein WJX72_000410 [[Myrmecia] bisecta]|uniref:CsbD family protein n=1 Tax=[Myrmecia] bisecta TaxID=41462 RepID=A0AAW1Q324_9CHLO